VANCSVVNDTMSIKLKQGLTGDYKEVYLGGTNYGRLYDDKWVREEVELQLEAADYFVSGLNSIYCVTIFSKNLKMFSLKSTLQEKLL